MLKVVGTNIGVTLNLNIITVKNFKGRGIERPLYVSDLRLENCFYLLIIL